MNERQAFENVVDYVFGDDQKKTKEIVKELSISVACLLDDLEDITQKDIEHIQNLVTQLENIVDPVGEKK
jgi:hypothetical protein